MALAARKRRRRPQKNLEVRNQLIAEYLPYVRRIVQRIATHLPPHVEIDDLVHVGVIGLIQALERYDPSRDNKFITYASFRIKGAVLSELRSRDYLSRSNRRKIREVEKAHSRLEQQLGRDITDEEVAGEMGIDLEELFKIKRVSNISFVSLEEIGAIARQEKDSLIGNLLKADREDALTLTRIKEIKRAVADAIDQLPEKEKLVVSMYYGEELTMKETGKVMQLTESRVSQIHSQAILHLRARLRRRGFLED
jgi:RNA polymerase sigma factor for flagellar operon FliA